jgi:NAD(P)-dependent dehydrogenase (short-subunit alcohol dehydrogenase family)
MVVGRMWDYQVVALRGVSAEDEATLNQYGLIGYELVAVATVAGTGGLLAYLKRGTPRKARRQRGLMAVRRLRRAAMPRLARKVAVVTGSSRGIVRAIALQFADEGADVVINYARSADEAHDVRTQVEAAGPRALVVQADLRSPAEAAPLVEEAARHLGGLDILVNNAGGGTPRPFIEVTEADYDTVVDLNLKGVFFASQAFARHLIGAGRPGRIITVSSVHEELPFPGHAAYCVAKGGVKVLTRDLAVELARHGGGGRLARVPPPCRRLGCLRPAPPGARDDLGGGNRRALARAAGGPAAARGRFFRPARPEAVAGVHLGRSTGARHPAAAARHHPRRGLSDGLGA